MGPKGRANNAFYVDHCRFLTVSVINNVFVRRRRGHSSTSLCRLGGL